MSGLGLTFLRRGNLAHPTAGSDYILSESRGDPEVFRILMANGVSSDGVGITKEDAARVTSIKNWFYNNKNITQFNELIYFTNVKSIESNAFRYCTALQSIDLSGVQVTNSDAFNGCTSLVNVGSLSNHTSFGRFAFVSAKIEGAISIVNFRGSLANGVFSGNNITSIEMPYVTAIGQECFYNNKKLEYVILEEGMTAINNYAFGYCTAMRYMICKASNPPSLTNANAFSNTTFLIYVPDESVDAYKAAANWSGYASRIKPLSEFNG